MSTTKYFAIAASEDLSNQPTQSQIEAVVRLKEYLEQHPDINTGDDSYYPVAYAADPVIKGQVDLESAFEKQLFCAELTASERQHVEGYGFQTREVGPHAFSLYAPG